MTYEKKIISHEWYETTPIFFRHNQDNGLKNVWCENFQNLTVGKLAMIFWNFFVFSIFFKNFEIQNFSFAIQKYFIFVLSYRLNHFFCSSTYLTSMNFFGWALPFFHHFWKIHNFFIWSRSELIFSDFGPPLPWPSHTKRPMSTFFLLCQMYMILT